MVNNGFISKTSTQYLCTLKFEHVLKLYPESALVQLEFDKVKQLLAGYAKTHFAQQRIQNLRIHTKKEYIELTLRQSYEYKLLLDAGTNFPNDFVANADKDIQLLGIPGALLTGEQFMLLRKLCENSERIFRWFDAERTQAFHALYQIITDSYYEKSIIESIDSVLDEGGKVKDNASPELKKIRMALYKKRNELRRVFERVVARLQKAGYTADIDESFSNGRRVVAVMAEYKRQVKGILHGESDSKRTSYIEPEETTELNNEVYSLEQEERREELRVLRQLTALLSSYSPLLKAYHNIAGEYDFIKAKAKLAQDMNGNLPNLVDKGLLNIQNAYHPLLLLYNKRMGKPTIPVTLTLNENGRILVISGPNAGGKTVAMKTIGLNQMMFQSGLLVPVSATSEMGIFKQLFIHIGDTQSIEFELSTYSSHLLHMKHFMENANGKTLFFIDELGSGSDPNLGGAFAEVIMMELAFKKAIGIVTTHYLNLKVMANHTAGIVNGAMAFDEKTLLPLYKLTVGKPGSSYTFAIAERIGLHPQLINKARKLVDDNHFQLDKLLNRTEQDLQKLDHEKIELQKLLKENERLKKELTTTLNKEKHQQQVELLKHQNKVTEEKWQQLKETERKLKHLVLDWRKSDKKEEVIKQMQAVLFPQQQTGVKKMEKKLLEKYQIVAQPIEVGTKVKLKNNAQIGTVKEIRGKRAVVQIGLLPMSVAVEELLPIQEKNVNKI